MRKNMNMCKENMTRECMKACLIRMDVSQELEDLSIEILTKFLRANGKMMSNVDMEERFKKQVNKLLDILERIVISYLIL